MKIKCSVFTAACLALAVVLRLILGRLPNADAVFCPLHLPVLLCGYACGAPFGLLCGALAPLIGWLVCSLPSPALLLAVTVECAAAGFVMGLVPARKSVQGRDGGFTVCLLLAMLIGRVSGALVLGLVYTRGLAAILSTMGLWLVSGLPGIVLMLVLLPALLPSLENEKLLPRFAPPDTQPATEADSQPTTEDTPQPATEAAAQPATEEAAQPATEEAPQPATEDASRPDAQPDKSVEDKDQEARQDKEVM